MFWNWNFVYCVGRVAVCGKRCLALFLSTLPGTVFTLPLLLLPGNMVHAVEPLLTFSLSRDHFCLLMDYRLPEECCLFPIGRSKGFRSTLLWVVARRANLSSI